MAVNFKALDIGQSYDRPFLAKLWGYQSYHAIAKGVITPINTNYIILFVTKEKQQALPQYNDFIDGNLLFWEGEERHSTDQRIINSINNQEEVHLFYRDTHHSHFIYFGKVYLLEYQLQEESPSEFIFQIESVTSVSDTFKEVREHANEYRLLVETEQDAIIKSRIGQGTFRANVIRLWGSCSVTGFQNITLLRASHIKPWKLSLNPERLNPYNGLLLIPNYDSLFDKGIITFKKNGQIIISKRLDLFGRRVFHVDENIKLRRVFPDNRVFLEFHNQIIFTDL